MRCLVVGLDDAARSCVIGEEEIVLDDLVPGMSTGALFKSRESPPRARPEGRGDLVDLGVEPGQCTWSLWRFEPGMEVAMHYTKTTDFDLVLEGTIELILNDGVHDLRPGDCVVMTGVDHAWRAGSDGCLISGIALGNRLSE